MGLWLSFYYRFLVICFNYVGLSQARPNNHSLYTQNSNSVRFVSFLVVKLFFIHIYSVPTCGYCVVRKCFCSCSSITHCHVRAHIIMSRNCSTWCRSLLLSFSTCYLGILGLIGGYKSHIGSNLPPKDNLQKEDKSSAPKVSFIRRFHCSCIHACISIYIQSVVTYTV